MAHTHDFIPSRDAEFDGWLANLTNYVDGKTASGAWTHIPAAKVTELKQHNTDWHAAYAKTLGPHTSVDTEAKNDARAAAEHFVRPFVAQFLKFDPVTNEDRTAMNLHNRDTTPTAHPTPDVKPEVEAVPAGKGKHIVTALNPETKSKQKPAFVSGVAFAHRLREQADPKSKADDMPSKCQTGVTKDFQWSEDDYGKVCDYACAYEADGGKRGPWSDVVSLIIS